LPTLKNGATYLTQGGANVTVTVRGNDYYINNAKIIASNQILENGVAHVIDQVSLNSPRLDTILQTDVDDQVIVPSTPAPIIFVGSASSMRGGTTQVVGLSFLLVLVTGLLL
jgi:hypothetical protein